MEQVTPSTVIQADVKTTMSALLDLTIVTPWDPPTFVETLKAHSGAIVRNAIEANNLTKKLDIVSLSYAKPDSKPALEDNVWMWTNALIIRV